MNRFLQKVGCAACVLAVVGMMGGHWLVLQSIAWARMVVVFSRSDSLTTAVAKTLSGHHPCALCLKIRHGWQEEQRPDKSAPAPKEQILQELFWEGHRASIPQVPLAAVLRQPHAVELYSDFTESPPTPPPRSSVSVL